MSLDWFRVEFGLQGRQLAPVAGSKETEVAYAHEAFGKDVLGVPAYELDSGNTYFRYNPTAGLDDFWINCNLASVKLLLKMSELESDRSPLAGM